jgi:hypothetical protein
VSDKERCRLLAEYAMILNHHGPDSYEAREFELLYADDDELTSLMMVSRTVKRVYTHTGERP